MLDLLPCQRWCLLFPLWRAKQIPREILKKNCISFCTIIAQFCILYVTLYDKKVNQKRLANWNYHSGLLVHVHWLQKTLWTFKKDLVLISLCKFKKVIKDRTDNKVILIRVSRWIRGWRWWRRRQLRWCKVSSIAKDDTFLKIIKL